jgi:hypothetical protein
MRIEAHIAKYRRLDDALARLRADVDYELWVWTAMNACVNLLNAALHRSGITDETDSFHTQVEGLYARPDRTSGRLVDAVHPPGDVMHAGQPALDTPPPEAIARASSALTLIEDLREPYVRGGQTPTASAVADWQQAYRTCVTELCAVLGVPVRR